MNRFMLHKGHLHGNGLEQRQIRSNTPPPVLRMLRIQLRLPTQPSVQLTDNDSGHQLDRVDPTLSAPMLHICLQQLQRFFQLLTVTKIIQAFLYILGYHGSVPMKQFNR